MTLLQPGNRHNCFFFGVVVGVAVIVVVGWVVAVVVLVVTAAVDGGLLVCGVAIGRMGIFVPLTHELVLMNVNHTVRKLPSTMYSAYKVSHSLARSTTTTSTY